MKTKTKYGMLLVAGLIFYQGIAQAEMLSGTITNIDMSGQNITLRRADTNADVTVHVKDKSALSSLASGIQVQLDAKKKLIGNKWETESVTPASNASNMNSAGASSSDSNTSGANSRSSNSY